MQQRESIDLRGGIAPWQLIDALPAAIYVIDHEGRITYFNEAAAALWGCRPKLGSDQWCGSWRLYWLDGTPMPHDQCPMAIALKQGSPVRGGIAIAERPDGTRVPFMAFPTPLRDSSGTLVGAVNMLIDISDRQRAERVEQHLAAIVGSSDDAIVSTDIGGVITTWNKAAERLFGYSEAEAIGKLMTILLPPDREKEIEDLQCVGLGENVDHFETVRQRKDGSLVNISLTASPISEAGKIVGASTIIRDITERKHAEERDALLRLAQASTGVGVYCWDVRTKELGVSPELEELFGLKPGSMKNYSDFRDRVHPDDIEYVEAHRDAVVQKPERFHHEFRIIRPNGETRWISSTGSAVYDEVTGQPIRILGSNFDITELKLAQERQRLLIAELDHRVKNILAQVAVVAGSTRQGSRSIRDFTRSLDGRIQSMAAAHTLLSETGWQNVGLGTLVRNQLAPYATGTNVTISGTDVVLNSSETQAIARVLHELATNAAKYGALSTRNGQVSVDWDLNLNGSATNLTLFWRERGGPPVDGESPFSYGTNLIRNLIPHELGGTVDLVFATEGVKCRIEIPLRHT